MLEMAFIIKNKYTQEEYVMANDGFMDEVQYQGSEENFVMDLTDVNEKAGFEAIPAGVYDAIVDSAEFGDSSKGSPMITWKFKLTDPTYNNRGVFYHTVLNTDLGKANLKKTLMRVCPDLDLGNFSPSKFCNEGEALGLPCRVKLKIQMYQGEKRNSVQEVLAAEASGSFLDT